MRVGSTLKELIVCAALTKIFIVNMDDNERGMGRLVMILVSFPIIINVFIILIN